LAAAAAAAQVLSEEMRHHLQAEVRVRVGQAPLPQLAALLSHTQVVVAVERSQTAVRQIILRALAVPAVEEQEAVRLRLRQAAPLIEVAEAAELAQVSEAEMEGPE
jgi:hypothetical protein